MSKELVPSFEWELPEGWTTATVGDLISAGGVFIDGDWVESKDQDPNGDVRLIQLADVADGYYKNKSSRFLTKQRALELNCTFLKKGDVLIARMPDPLGRACIYPGDAKESVTVVDVCVIRTGSEDVSHKWLMYWVNSPEFRNTISSLQSGTTRRRISRTNLATITFPFPPPEQQKRIAAKIEELFIHIDAGIASLQAAKKLLKQYRQSVLKAAVTGELTKDWRKANKDKLEPASQLLERILKERRQRWEEQQLEQFEAKGKMPKDDKWKKKYKEPSFQSSKDESELPNVWCWASICQVANVVSGQTTKGIAESLGTGEIPWFKVGDMNTHGNEKYMLISKSMLTREEAVKCKVNIQPENTIIFPKRGGAIATNKKRILAMPSAYDLNTMGMSPILIDLGFLWTWFLCIDLDSISNGSNVPQINHKDIEPLDIPLPPLDEQYEISRTTQEKLEAIERLDTEISHDVKKAEKNKQSILASAFNGNL